MVEPAATNNASYGSDWTNAVWMKSSTVSTAKTATGPDNVANSASTLTFSGAGGIGRSITKGSASVEAMSVYARRSGALSGSIYMNVSNATSGTSLVTGTDSDFSGAGNWVNRSDAGGNAVVTGGRLEISQGTGSTQKGRAELALTGLTIGRVYRVLVDGTANVVGTSSQGVSVYTGANLTGTQVCNLSVVGALNQTYHFVATETTMYLVFTTTGAGNTFTFAVDDVEVFAMAETDVTSQITTSWTRLGEVQTGSVQNPAFSLRATAADAIEVALFQSETGSAVTSPIPTYATAVLRASDNPEIATALFPYNASEGTVYIEYTLDSLPAAARRIIALDDNSATVRVLDVYQAGASIVAFKSVDSGNFSVSMSAGASGKLAIRYKADDYHSAYNGVLGTPDTATGAMQTATMLELGHLANASHGAVPLLIERAGYFPDAKANATLTGITTP